MENIQKPLTVEEIKKLRKPIRNINNEIQQKLSILDRLAVWITDKVGSMSFFLIIFIWTMAWLGWNMFAPNILRFDPYPAFVLWLFISNMIQIFLMPLIMVGQNLISDHAEARAESDFEVNTVAETEVLNILVYLENQNKLILQILDRLDKTNQANNRQ